jgi:hypothetical protein
MAVTVSLRGRTKVKKVVLGTKVKKVVVGKPIRRVVGSSGNIDNLTGVSTTGAVEGSLLIYNESTEKWEAKLTLEEQEISGGQY